MTTKPHNTDLTQRRRLPLLTLCGAAAAVLAWLIPSLSEAFEFQRGAVATGQLWRLLSCHFAHWSADHLAWDLLGFVILGVICENRGRRAMLLTVAVSAVAIPVGVWLLLPEMTAYRGLSGIDSALFGLAVALLAREGWRRKDKLSLVTVGLAAFGFVAKLGYEILDGSAFFVNSQHADMVPVPLAHLIGLAVGAGIWLLTSRRENGSPGKGQRWMLRGTHCP